MTDAHRHLAASQVDSRQPHRTKKNPSFPARQTSSMIDTDGQPSSVTPSLGPRMDIQYDRYSLIINGQRTFLRSGAMHYFRLPSQTLWEDRLFKLKAAGYNAVDLYFCWDYHSPEPGVYDFTGIRDVRRLLEMTRELGLYVIARPGPYINAEYSGGGFPGWMLAKRDLPLRNRKDGALVWSEEYMDAVREWWGHIIPIINESPNILLMQIENEYATLEIEPDYMQALYDLARKLGVKVPLFHNDLYAAGLYSDIVDLYAFDNYSVTHFERNWRQMPGIFSVLDHIEQNLRPFCENRPLFAAELQAGWFGGWKGHGYNEIIEHLGREHINVSTKSLIGQGLTMFNHYKAIGGTNWDTIGSVETYTSYDFAAPISESGLNTERLFEAKALNYILQSFDLAATNRTQEAPVHFSDPSVVYAIRQHAERPGEYWLFLRNLSGEAVHLTMNGQVPLQVNPFEVILLPYQVKLASGHTLGYSTNEPVYQSPHLLILEGEKPTHLELQGAIQATQHPRIQLIQTQPDTWQLQCPALSPDEAEYIQLGDLTVVLLGANWVDTLWLEEDGTLVSGAHARHPDGTYGLKEGQNQLLVIRPDGRVSRQEKATLPLPAIPELTNWVVQDAAPELATPEVFKPVSPEGADFDTNGHYEGSGWYLYAGSGPWPTRITIDARHIWATFLNGQYLANGHHFSPLPGEEQPAPAMIPIPKDLWREHEVNHLVIFVDGLGHPKGFHDDQQTPQGLLLLKLDQEEVTNQVYFSSGFSFEKHLDLRVPEREHTPVARLESRFSLDIPKNIECPVGLQLQDMNYERVNIYLNDVLIGRHWRACQCQDTFYLPTGIIQTGPGSENKLELVLMNFDPEIPLGDCIPVPNQVSLKPLGVLTKVHVKTDEPS